ncbi:MAG TPA: substrate-binding domain-containing protein, partial [Rubrivivax sp.]|nr:substrate-binding domain-containing protein [Rubrivivax sp.]
MTRPTLSWLAAAALAALLTALPLGTALAQNKGEVKIALIASKSGPLEAYAKQTIVGFNLGLEYATGGTMMVAGKKLVVIEKDDQGKPDVGKNLLAQAYADDKVDIAVGPTASPVALAMLPVAEEYKKILLVEPAVADSITGDKWNKYIFRTGRNSSQDAIANAVALDQAGTSIVTLAQDNAFGKDGVKAFKDAVKKAKVVYEEYLPAATTDFTAAGQRIIDKLKDQPGKKLVWIIWAGGNPFKIADMDLKRYGIEIATGGNILPAMVAYKQFPGMEGGAYYYFGIPKNKVNEWLVARHYSQFKSPPDFFTAGGMAAGIAVVEALKKTSGDTDTNKLIAAMEGMSFETPKGKMSFRKEDHQAMQDMYHFKIKVDPA